MIVVDVETGGLIPEENPLLSIGAVKENGDTFYTEIMPRYGTVTEEAIKVNGYNPDEWMDRDLGSELERFFKWCGNETVLAGHNPTFDLGYLRHGAKLSGLKCPFGYRTIDLHSAAYVYCVAKDVKFEKLTSNEIYKLLGMMEEPNPHNALNGALWEFNAFDQIKRNLQ